MVKKALPFHSGCSSRTCTQVKAEVYTDYDKKYYRKHKMKTPQPHDKGGAKTVVMEQAQVRKIGWKGTYTVKEHGVAIEAKRCREWHYIDRNGEWQKPTCTERRVYNIPRNTLRCYQQVSDLLTALTKAKKAFSRPPTTSNKILALLGCSKSDIGKTQVPVPLSPYIIAPVIGIEHNAVRKTMENLISSKKVTSSYPVLDVVDEKQNRLEPRYQKDFDTFIKTENQQRKWTAFRRIFTGEFEPAQTIELPEPQAYKTFKVARSSKPPSRGIKGERIIKAPRKTDVFKREAYESEFTTDVEREWAQEAENA